MELDATMLCKELVECGRELIEEPESLEPMNLVDIVQGKRGEIALVGGATLNLHLLRGVPAKVSTLLIVDEVGRQDERRIESQVLDVVAVYLFGLGLVWIEAYHPVASRIVDAKALRLSIHCVCVHLYTTSEIFLSSFIFLIF